MPLDQLVERPGQRRLVEHSPQAQRQAAVVLRVVRLELGEEPQPLLGEGQRQRPGAFGARDPTRAPAPAGQPVPQLLL